MPASWYSVVLIVAHASVKVKKKDASLRIPTNLILF